MVLCGVGARRKGRLCYEGDLGQRRVPSEYFCFVSNTVPWWCCSVVCFSDIYILYISHVFTNVERRLYRRESMREWESSDDETSFSYFDIAVITAATCKGVVVVDVCVYLCVLI